MKLTAKIYIILFIVLLMSCGDLWAQSTITPQDSTICLGNSITLNTVNSGASVTITDDKYTSVIPIGFTFNFYGVNYTQCVFSSNGYINFNTSNAGAFSPWSIASGIPGNTALLNSIAGYYADIFPPSGGTLDYVTIGVAPNRKFIISFCDAAMFSCTTLKCAFQIILYETSNLIDIQLRQTALCTSWNNGAAIEGVQNASGTDAVVVPGRNYPTQWNATQSGHRFTPTLVGSINTYTVAPITYKTYPNSYANVKWKNAAGTVLAVGLTQTFAPTSTTWYYTTTVPNATSNCIDSLFDSVRVFVTYGATIDSIVKIEPATCGGYGTLTFFGLTPNIPYKIFYLSNGNADSVLGTANSAGTITIFKLAGVYTNFQPNVNQINNVCHGSIFPGPITLTDPPLTANYTNNVKWGCGQDTVLFQNTSVTSGNMSYKWTFGDGTTDTAKSPQHIFKIQGIYNVKLIASNGVCKDSSLQTIDLTHPLLAAFTMNRDSACQGIPFNFNNTSITTTKNSINPTYFWDFGDGNSSTAMNPTHVFQNTGTYTVNLIVQDFVPCSDTFRKTIIVDSIPYVDFSQSAVTVCEGKIVNFNGDMLPIGLLSYQWNFGDGTHINNINPIAHAYDTSGTFTIKLTAHYRLCPDTFISKNLTVYPYPNINLGVDTAICPNGNPITLVDAINAGNSAATYLWNTGATTPYITVNTPAVYYSTVTINGCSNTDSITVNNDCYLSMPNSFTPNGDGLNDYFFPRQFLSRSVVAFRMQIFDRWGVQVFETNSLNGRGWDGKFNDQPQPSGAYVYIIDVVFANNVKEHYVGNVTLLK